MCKQFHLVWMMWAFGIFFCYSMFYQKENKKIRFQLLCYLYTDTLRVHNFPKKNIFIKFTKLKNIYDRHGLRCLKNCYEECEHEISRWRRDFVYLCIGWFIYIFFYWMICELPGMYFHLASAQRVVASHFCAECLDV